MYRSQRKFTGFTMIWREIRREIEKDYFYSKSFTVKC